LGYFESPGARRSREWGRGGFVELDHNHERALAVAHPLQSTIENNWTSEPANVE